MIAQSIHYSYYFGMIDLTRMNKSKYKRIHKTNDESNCFFSVLNLLENKATRVCFSYIFIFSFM